MTHRVPSCARLWIAPKWTSQDVPREPGGAANQATKPLDVCSSRNTTQAPPHVAPFSCAALSIQSIYGSLRLMAATKDKRLTIRLTDELWTWLEEEAAKKTLDMATFTRMRLQEMKDGSLARAEHPMMIVAPTAVRSALLPERIEYVDGPSKVGRVAEAGSGYDPNGMVVVNNTDNAVFVNPDDLVAQALAAAGNAGVTQPRQQDTADDFMGSVRPVGERVTRDPYNMKQYAR